jgi:apolipoprotein N-acyltransferase
VPDRWWQTLLWLACASAAWWCVQPGGILPPGLVGLSAIVWVGVLVRAAVAAGGYWTVLGTAWVLFLVPWLFVLVWVRDVSAAGWIPLAMYSAAYPAMLAVLIRWVDRGPLAIPLSVTVGVLGLSLEYIRAEILFDAWPFHLAGHALWGSPQIMVASLGGVWACSLLVFSTGGLLAAVLPSGRWQPRTWEWVCPAALIVVASVIPSPRPAQTPAASVLAVQTNLPQNNKIGWPLDRQQADIESFLSLTAGGFDDPDLVVWPETMVPGLGFDPATMGLLDSLGSQADAVARWPRLMMQQVVASGTTWLIGSPTWSGVQIVDGSLVPSQRFNSAVLLGPDGLTQRYDKTFLTPFGETMPYVRAWPWLESVVMDFGAAGMRFDLDSGDHTQPLHFTTRHGDTWRIATPVCFEDAVPSVTRSLCVHDGRVDADAIINISNDGWFGSSDAGREAHAVAAAFRAVEMGRPLLRVANTGITSLFLPDGTTAASLDPRVAESMVVDLPRYEGQTLQARWGNWLPRLCLVLAVVGLIVRWAGTRSKTVT